MKNNTTAPMTHDQIEWTLEGLKYAITDGNKSISFSDDIDEKWRSWLEEHVAHWKDAYITLCKIYGIDIPDDVCF